MGLKSKIVISESIEELMEIQSKQVSLKAEKRVKFLITLKLNKFKNQGSRDKVGECPELVVFLDC